MQADGTRRDEMNTAATRVPTEAEILAVGPVVRGYLFRTETRVFEVKAMMASAYAEGRFRESDELTYNLLIAAKELAEARAVVIACASRRE